MSEVPELADARPDQGSEALVIDGGGHGEALLTFREGSTVRALADPEEGHGMIDVHADGSITITVPITVTPPDQGRSLDAALPSDAGLRPDVERACKVMHDAYEAAAVGAGWETQTASRKPWADVPETNKATMRAAVSALLDWLGDAGVRPTPDARAALDAVEESTRRVFMDADERRGALWALGCVRERLAASPPVGSCRQCGGPLTEARTALGLTLCSGACHIAARDGRRCGECGLTWADCHREDDGYSCCAGCDHLPPHGAPPVGSGDTTPGEDEACCNGAWHHGEYVHEWGCRQSPPVPRPDGDDTLRALMQRSHADYVTVNLPRPVWDYLAALADPTHYRATQRPEEA